MAVGLLLRRRHQGLDEITEGGLPRGRPTSCAARPAPARRCSAWSPSCGGATQYDEPGMFLAFEETAEELASNVATLGFNVPRLIREGRLAIDFVLVDGPGSGLRRPHQKGHRVKEKKYDPAESLARAAAQQKHARYVLKLYVAGVTPRSAVAIKSVTAICEQHLRSRYELEVIDIYQRPTLAKGEQILAAPTLIKQLPLPLKRIIGDMANEQKVLIGLDLRPAA